MIFTFDGMERRTLEESIELDGFGYMHNDSGNYGEASPEDGLALIELRDSGGRPKNAPVLSSPEAQGHQVDTRATKCIVAEVFLGSFHFTKKFQVEDVQEEEANFTTTPTESGTCVSLLIPVSNSFEKKLHILLALTHYIM